MENVIREDVIKLGFEVDFKSLTKLQDEFNDLKKTVTGDMGSDALDDLKKSANDAKSPLKKLTNTAKDVVKEVANIGKKAATTAFNGLKKVVGVSFKALTNGIKTAITKVTELGKKAGSTAYNALKKVAGISFKALAVGIGTAATAVGGLVYKSVQAYAEYEQLVGGVETLLGAKGAKNVNEYAKMVGKSVGEVKGEYETLMASQNTVLKNANNAYKTAGMSANDYMNTVTSFSASLLQSFGGDTKKTAKYADMAVQDMSDNANKMGTDIDSIVQTYQSLARGNFAMLDNLNTMGALAA